MTLSCEQFWKRITQAHVPDLFCCYCFVAARGTANCAHVSTYVKQRHYGVCVRALGGETMRHAAEISEPASGEIVDSMIKLLSVYLFAIRGSCVTSPLITLNVGPWGA